jgi:hypothetical protein
MKNNPQFKTLRHIETVRNYINEVIKGLISRQELHDQSKLHEPELSIFHEYTPKLREISYGSEEYKKCMCEMKTAIDHHQKCNRHHPEYFSNGILGMTLIDIVEMLCDWKAATLRHQDGNIYKSLEINAKRFGYSEELHCILKNTIDWLELQPTFHHGEES